MSTKKSFARAVVGEAKKEINSEKNQFRILRTMFVRGALVGWDRETNALRVEMNQFNP